LVMPSWRQRLSTTWVLSLVNDVHADHSWCVLPEKLGPEISPGLPHRTTPRRWCGGALLLMSRQAGWSCWSVMPSWRQRLSTTWVHSLVSGVQHCHSTPIHVYTCFLGQCYHPHRLSGTVPV
jgi:hypothetical protein